MKIEINKSDLEDFIWMSYRYCIGRHTIAASMHADTIMTLIKQNPDIMNEERAIFNARDIRNEINRCLSFKENVQIDGNEDGKDIFSVLLYTMEDLDPKWHKFYFNAKEMCISSTEELISPLQPWESFDADYIDLIPWVKLANWLDSSCHKILTIEDNGVASKVKCYPFPIQIHKGEYYEYEQAWTPVENPSSLSICTFISPECIKNIE